MVILNKIYTRTGDDGMTALNSGERRLKNDLRIEAYGTVDEANSAIGLARIETARAHAELDGALMAIQNDLFDLGADLATPEGSGGERELRIVQAQVDRIEAEIDRFNAELKPLRSFVLPGGSPAAAYLHLARTVARRAERLMVALSGTEKVNEAAIRYINRVSDFLFVAARHANSRGEKDILWVPGKNR